MCYHHLQAGGREQEEFRVRTQRFKAGSALTLKKSKMKGATPSSSQGFEWGSMDRKPCDSFRKHRAWTRMTVMVTDDGGGGDHHTVHTTSCFVLRSKGPGAACCRLTLSASSQHRIPRADFPLLSVPTAHSISAAVLRRQRFTSGQERTGPGVREPSPSPKPASEGPA